MTVTINGTKYEIGENELLIVIGNKITIGTNFSGEFKHSDQSIMINGNVGNITTNRNVNVADKVSGNITAVGSVNVGGDAEGVTAQGNVTVNGTVRGNVATTGEVRCGDVGGDVKTVGNVNCGNVTGKITTVGNVYRN